jgi:hypothetical protein
MRALSKRRLLVAGLMLGAGALFSTPGMANPLISGGYAFTNFDLPGGGMTNVNGIANTGAVVGFATTNQLQFTNSVRTPGGITSTLNLGASDMALGINSAGDVVGLNQASGTAFFLPVGGAEQTISVPYMATGAFGINDHGNIVGQYSSGAATPGFFIQNAAGNGLITINAPSGANVVNPQGVNDNGLAVGFYLGTDGQDHGFTANLAQASGGAITGSAVADPVIPNIPGEPGATFVFSQILGVNDGNIAVGYYGDSTTSQHGFLLNLLTGVYTFLDNPSMQFSNGVETTQITGINNLGDITGFYSDASGNFHGFTACPLLGNGSSCTVGSVPEPGSLALACIGLVMLGFGLHARSRAQRASSAS